jgi:hypothetical protein
VGRSIRRGVAAAWLAGAVGAGIAGLGVTVAGASAVPGSWSVIASPDATPNLDNTLTAVSCVSASFCMAVGDADNGSGTDTLAEMWNGAAWTITASPDLPASPGDELTGVSCLSEQFCMASGYAYNGSHDVTLIEQWDGAAWSIVSSPDTTASDPNLLRAISCTTTTSCVAVGTASSNSTFQTLIETWQGPGAGWTITPSPDSSAGQANQLSGVSCAGGGFCMAIGHYNVGNAPRSLAEVWNGGDWSMVPSPSSVGYQNPQLNGISCTSASFCVAVGTAGSVALLAQNLTETWDGGSWSITPSPDTSLVDNYLQGVSCSTPSSCVAAGYRDGNASYALQALQWDGSAWTMGPTLDAPGPVALGQGAAVSCGAASGCTVVSAYQVGAALKTLVLSAPLVHGGYDEVASDGGIFTFGGAPFWGSTGALHLNQPIVGMASTPDGGGYWLVASDGGIFAFGNAQFHGSTGSLHLNRPIVGMAATPDGGGYWLVASDGGIFAFGDAGYFGSQGATPLNRPIVGMAATRDGGGYWLVASDGGIFTHGDAGYFGSQGATPLNRPIVGMASTPSGQGYWLVASDGGIFTHGDAAFDGSMGATRLNRPIVGLGS